MGNNALKTAAKGSVNTLNALRRRFAPRRVFLYAPDAGPDVADLEQRIRFYFGDDIRITHLKSPAPTWLLAHGPVLTFRPKDAPPVPLFQQALGVFDVNFRTNSIEAWNWFDAEVFLNGSPDPAVSRRSYDAWKRKVLAEGHRQATIFGTGPSLAKAIERDWSQDIRLVCNTIVRDAELWHHIAPHAVVAGDGLYHYGPTEFARTFRADLLKRLRESPDTVFIYPDLFHSLVAREIQIEPERLIPIRRGTAHTVHATLRDDFALPALGNVLNQLLLPIACDLSKSVRLWGFDGRAPSDVLFWSNSNKHSYPELMHTLKEHHPAFFDHFVPAHDPESYVRAVHGDVLEHCLSQAEQQGWHFEMLHKSWTPTLSRRLAPDVEPAQ